MELDERSIKLSKGVQTERLDLKRLELKGKKRDRQTQIRGAAAPPPVEAARPNNLPGRPIPRSRQGQQQRSERDESNERY